MTYYTKNNKIGVYSLDMNCESLVDNTSGGDCIDIKQIKGKRLLDFEENICFSIIRQLQLI